MYNVGGAISGLFYAFVIAVGSAIVLAIYVLYNVFGFIPWTYWLYKGRIKWYDAPTVEYYDCSCGECEKRKGEKEI